MPKRVKISKGQFGQLGEMISCQSIAEKGRLSGVLELDGKTVCATGAVGTGTGVGWSQITIYEVTPIEEYDGDLWPKTYSEHWFDVDMGDRPRCYRGMKSKWQGKYWVFSSDGIEVSPRANKPQAGEYFSPDLPSYFGGKGSCFRHIINQVPPHKYKVIGFMGKCAVTRFMKPCVKTMGFDLDTDVVCAWEKMAEHSEHDISVYQLDFLEQLKRMGIFDENTYTYLDPTYRHTTRSSDTRYKFEMTDEQHVFMLERSRLLPGCVDISHYPNDMYDEILKGWRHIDFNSTDRAGNVRIERLYMNYPEPTELHDYSYLGSDYRQRENIAKRERSMLGKISKLDALERLRLFEKIKEGYPTAFSNGVSSASGIMNTTEEMAVAADTV